MAVMSLKTSTIGFPRIGPNREMKKALELYWKGGSALSSLLFVADQVDKAAWKLQADAGIGLVGLDGTLYDQVLDWTFYLGLAPPRFKKLQAFDKYFAMARGTPAAVALDMSKFFDTNYHYMVPELDLALVESAVPDFAYFLERVKKGQSLVGKASAVPIVIGPNTLVGLAKPSGDAPLDKSAAIQALVPSYVKLLKELKALGIPEVQIHEPILTAADSASFKADFEAVYAALAVVGVPINLVTYYDDIGESYSWVVGLPVQAISLDFLGVPGSAYTNGTIGLIEKYGFPADKRLGAGVVDGRSVWADSSYPTTVLAALLGKGIKNIAVQSSVSLQHLPYDTAMEKNLPQSLVARLSFATQKLAEIVNAAKAAPSITAGPLSAALPSVGTVPQDLDAKLFVRKLAFEERRGLQVQMPAFPTTSIGSFPQTPEIRRARLLYKTGKLGEAEYEAEIKEYIRYAIQEQDKLGIDVMVHGEPERTDMVEFFGVKLDGFAFTDNGWVQSYGSRYVRPPIIHSDISRPAPMTVKEFLFAQSLTKKPVKGMLTGPVTILNWSFPRKDISRQAQAFQLAQALRSEVADLEAAGCQVIQVDEPALREGLPLKKERWASYLDWAVDAFKLATVVAAPSTQIVTHLCYSEFADILPAIDGLDADVLTIENSRSGNEMIEALAKYGYSRDIGPGVYDVHSPVVPTCALLPSFRPSFLSSILPPCGSHKCPPSILPSFLISLVPSFLPAFLPSCLASFLPSFRPFFLWFQRVSSFLAASFLWLPTCVLLDSFQPCSRLFPSCRTVSSSRLRRPHLALWSPGVYQLMF